MEDAACGIFLQTFKSIKLSLVMATENILISILRLLNVRHTTTYSNKVFGEHPHKYNLYGISKILSNYGIENVGLTVKDKEKDLEELQLPFIAHISDDFRIVSKVGPEYVETIWRGKPLKTPREEFLNIWSGVVLILGTDHSSIEPEYQKNRKKELFDILQKALLVILLSVCLFFPFVLGGLYKDLWKSLLFLFNLTGIGVCFLLVEKQLQVRSEYADKICSLFSKGDCNNILESDAAKFMGVIGWSEAGLGYFISSTLLLLYFPHLISYAAIINICALPYSFWSVWYQKTKAKQWCPLCLMVQALFWCLFLVHLFAHNIQLPIITWMNGIQILSLYFIPFLLLNVFIPQLSENKKTEQITQEINSIKANEVVFTALLKDEPYYMLNKSTSNIIFGNPDGKILITIFTNPHCNPCAEMHTRIEELLKQNDELCIQYIFGSFHESLNSSNKFLIAIYQHYNIDETKKIYSEWFTIGKNEKNAFFEKYLANFENEKTETEFKKHELWKLNSQLTSTPSIFVNGHKLPYNYKIEDLAYFSEL